MIYIQLHQGTSLISRLIKWQTRSKYSHASVLYQARVVESVEGHGVREVPASYYDAHRLADAITIYRVRGLTIEQEAQVVQFMRDEIGTPYDWHAVFKFVTRRRHASDKRWFCSELVFDAFRAAGVTLLHNVEAWQVSPGSLAMSPLLERLTSLHAA